MTDPMRATDLEQNNRTYHMAQDHMALLPNYYRWIYGDIASELSGEVVELGCGAGLGIATYVNSEKVERVYAVDHNPELLTRVESTLNSDKVQTIEADLTGDWNSLSHIRADWIVMTDVVEHFEDDAAFIDNAAGLLKDGGHMVIKVPAQSRLFSSMDQASGHFRRYDDEDIGRLAQRCGLKAIRIRHMNPVGGWAYSARNGKKTNFSRSFSPATLRLINLGLPLLQYFDKVSPFKGLSILAVLRKKPAAGAAAPADA